MTAYVQVAAAGLIGRAAGRAGDTTMATNTSFAHSSAGFAAAIVRAAGWIVRQVVALVRVFLHRRDVRLLLELDERQLRDIGLLRNDVLGALAAPLATDPSTILLVRSVERRAGRRLALIPRRVKLRSTADA